MLWILFLSLAGVSSLFRNFERLMGLISFVGFGYLIGTPNYTYNGDAVVYLYNYVYGANSFERGYNWLTDIFEGKIDYQSFRLFSSIVLYVMIFFVVLLFTKHVSIVAFGYGIAMFPFDNEQVRNAMAAFFVLLGALFLVKQGSKSIAFSLAIILIGSLFHTLALFFLILPVFWLFRVWIRKHFKILFITASLVAFGFQIVGSSGLVPVISNLAGKLSTRADVSGNISTIYSGTGLAMRYWFIFYGVTLLVLITGWIIGRNAESKNEPYFDLFLCSVLMWTIALMLVTISIDYVRILRLVMFFYLILIARNFSVSSVSKSGALTVVVLCSSMAVMILQFWAYGIDAQTIKSIFGFLN